MKEIDSKKIVLIEDHHQAYYAWKTRGLKNLALIHIDAHIDFNYLQLKDARLILKEANSLPELKNLLEKILFFKQKQFYLGNLTNIANYVYPAMREGIVRDFYWVIPGDNQEFRRRIKDLKSMIEILAKQDLKPKTVIKIKNGVIKSRLYGQNFNICSLQAMPSINKKVLLDIDTDFLVINSIAKSKNTDQIEKRKIWIEPERLIGIIKRKVKSAVLVTIAYSVNGGYTPLKFKYLGDEIASLLQGNIFKMPPAAKAFNLFNESWRENNKIKAKYYYRKAIKCDPAYAASSNNYGYLYLAKKYYKKAKNEFQKILYCHPRNKDALCGMGQLFLNRRKYKAAKLYFNKALSVDSEYPKALFGIGCADIKLEKYKSAKRILIKLSNLKSNTAAL